MAVRLSKGPYYVAEIDIHLINDVFRRIQREIDELRGLATADGDTIEIGPHDHTSGSGGALSHDDLADVSVNDHHNQVHSIGGSDHTGSLDASNITFTPATLSNWTGSTDPGQTDDGLDQLASRTAALEAISGTGQTDISLEEAGLRIRDQVMAGTGVSIEEIADGSGDAIVLSVDTSNFVEITDSEWVDLTDGGETTLHSHAGGGSSSGESGLVEGIESSVISDQVFADPDSMVLYEQDESNAVRLRPLQVVYAGDDLVGQLQLVTDSNGSLVYA